MIDQVLFEHIESTLTQFTFRYGSAENTEYPFVVVRKISDLERSTTLCKNQGECGKALFQFSCYTGSNSAESLIYANSVKKEIAKILGVLGTTNINANETKGAVILNNGDNTNLIWSAIFETTLSWESV